MDKYESDTFKQYFIGACIFGVIILPIVYVCHNFAKTDQLVAEYAESCNCHEHKWMNEGYNQACDDWEKYVKENFFPKKDHIHFTMIGDDQYISKEYWKSTLPTEEEIFNIIESKKKKVYTSRGLAKAIHKRLKETK